VKSKLSAIQQDTWTLCVAHFEALACEVVRDSVTNPDARAVTLSLMAQRFREARRSCIDSTSAERKVHGRDFGGAA
jgi:hypothetical protein